jgi:phospholipid transport system substrate-binding protein
MSNRRLILPAIALALFVASPARAASPTETLQAFFASANTILQSADPTRGLDEPRRAIRLLVDRAFDYQEAAELVLGPVWQTRTPAQQGEFVRLFADFLERGFVAMIASKASVASGVSVQYLGESIDGQSATVSTTVLTRSGSDLPVDYSMLRWDGRWMVRDVVIEGVSLIANYRAQFTRVIRASSYAALISRMRGDAAEPPQPERALVVTAELIPVKPAVTAPAPKVTVAPPPPVEQPLISSPPPSAPRPTPAPIEPPARPSVIAATSYWVQVGAFKTVDAAARVAGQLRRAGITAFNSPLITLPGQSEAALARVRVGPFASRADAQLKLHELVGRGYTPFIAEAHN